jgi:hypothetical protein
MLGILNEQVEELKEDGTVTGGMIPKVGREDRGEGGKDDGGLGAL